MPTSAEAPSTTRRERWAWYLYAFGNSAYASVVLLAVYAAYFQGKIVGGSQGSLLWGLAVGIAMLGIRYPRRLLIRTLLRGLDWLAFALLTRLEVHGQENCPKQGPLIVVANHFDYTDPVLMVRVAPWPLDFWGGFRMPNAPAFVTWIPKLWGYYHVHRGGYSREAIRAGEAVLKQGGVLGIYPEAGNWARVLRRPRPGAAFLAARTGVRILPMGFDGLGDVFPALGRWRRARVVAQIGKVFGPFSAPPEGPGHRRRIEEIGDEIMRHIAELLPPEKRGVYSDDAVARAEAERYEYPFAKEPDI